MGSVLTICHYYLIGAGPTDATFTDDKKEKVNVLLGHQCFNMYSMGSLSTGS